MTETALYRPTTCAALRPSTRLVAVVHASNVTGAVQPVEAIGPIVREHGALFLVDAAQSLGHVPLDVSKFEVDLVAAPGHKGLLGPLGTGVLYIRPGIERELEPLRYGGTGTRSDEDRQPDELPDKFEPGNHNLPGLAGLVASCEFLSRKSIAAVHAHHTALTARLLERLQGIDGLTIHGPNIDRPAYERGEHHTRRLRPAGAGRRARIGRTASNAAPVCTVPRGCTNRWARRRAAARSA